MGRTGACALALALSACGEGSGGQHVRDASTQADSPDSGPVEPAWEPPLVMYPGEHDARDFALSELGLYRELSRHELAPDLIPFTPVHALWSDGALKARWLRLPPGTAIDASDPAHFVLPVGAVLFKEFRSPSGARLETRVIARLFDAGRDSDYFMGAFLWNDDESDALLVRDGADDVRGSDHDVPSQERCSTCHRGEPGRVLGLSAIQQGSSGAVPGLDVLEAMGVIAPKVSPRVLADIPGDDTQRAALGYLNANCGHCHNPSGTARPDTDMELRLYPGEQTLEQTAIYRSTFGKELQNFAAPGLLRLTPSDPEHSALYTRMAVRLPKLQMPPIATEHIDDDGLEQVRAFIAALPPK